MIFVSAGAAHYNRFNPKAGNTVKLRNGPATVCQFDKSDLCFKSALKLNLNRTTRMAV